MAEKKTTKKANTDKPVMKKKSISNEEVDPVKAAKLQEKIISKKKVLFTEIDDEITNIYDKLKKYKMKNIYIVVPKRAIVFQSIVNLKILKRKSDDLKKNVYIITNDKNGMQLAQRAGFTVFDKLEGDEHPSLVSGKLEEDKLKITPLEASINTFEDDTPTRMTSKKLSIAELIRRGKKSQSSKAKRTGKSKSKKAKKDKYRYVLVSPNRQGLAILITITILVLILITYIALPSTTITLTPKSNTLSASTNITLVELPANQAYLDTHPRDVIASFPTELTFSKSITYFTTGNKFEGKNATGTITIKNTSGRDWPLIEQTRFQSLDGLVYRIQNNVTVPSGSLSGPGTLDVFVVADETDAFGQIIGDRGNIEPSKFFLPGLSEDNQTKLFGESSSSFSGGETITHKIITADDLIAAQEKMKEELRDAAEEELKKQVAKMNQERGIELTLLIGHRAIELGEPTATVAENLEGQLLNEFEVQGEIFARGLAYNYNEVSNILSLKLKLSKSPEKRLLKIDSETITYQLMPLEEGSDPTRVTITATIKGIEQYEISPDRENGRRLIENIKEHILGKSTADAETFIQQLPEINKVEISSWPAWAPTLPSVPDNINIKVEEML